MIYNCHLHSLVTLLHFYLVGLLYFVYLMFLGSVVFGPVTDRYGRKKGLVISLFGLTVGMDVDFG